MRILIVNDDGYTSPGIRLLASALSNEHEVMVVAPIKCNSGMAHAMTFNKNIYLKKINIEENKYGCYSLTGTPADCVKLGTELMTSNPPDIIISGINNEPNIGTTLVYSGTAHAAMEASVLGYKSISLSSNPTCDEDFEYVVNYFKEHLELYLSLCSNEYTLNVNINNPHVGNIEHKVTPLGVRLYSDIYLVSEEDENGVPHKLIGNPLPVNNVEDCDVTWFEKGYATITPLTSDHTLFSKINDLKKVVNK